MEKDVQKLAENFMKKGYQVYFRGKREDLKNLFNDGEPLGILLTETTNRIENLERLQALGEGHHNNRAIKDELKELKSIKSNFKDLRENLGNKEINTREAINEFLGKKGSEGNRSFADLIKSLVYKIFPSIYEKDKKKVVDGIISDLTEIEKSRDTLNREIKNRQKEFLKNPVEQAPEILGGQNNTLLDTKDKKEVVSKIESDLTKVKVSEYILNKEIESQKKELLKNPVGKVTEILVDRIDTLSEIKNTLIEVCALRPKAELNPGGVTFNGNSLESNYQKMPNDNISVMKEILRIDQEIKELQSLNYRLAKLEDRLGNNEKPAGELFDKLKSKLGQTMTVNAVVTQIHTLLDDLSNKKDVEILKGFEQLKKFQNEVSVTAEALELSAKPLTYEAERTNRKESDRQSASNYEKVDNLRSELSEARAVFKKHEVSVDADLSKTEKVVAPNMAGTKKDKGIERS